MSGIQTIPLQNIGLSQTESQRARRKQLTPDSLAELAESIIRHGVLQPIIVRPWPRAAITNGTPEFELVAGERRLAASRQAGLEIISAVVRDLKDEEVLEVQLIENLQREDIHPMHEAEGYHQLIQRHHRAAEELAARVGKSRSYVYGRLKLLDLSPAARKAFYADQISPSVALLIARIPGEKLQREALKELALPNVVSFRRAQEIVSGRYMLQLKEAPFPTEEDLNGAGACGTCPKRTGNQAELFGDVKSPDVCTDPECFRGKSRAYGQRLLDQAKKSGQPVIAGKKAKQVAPNGIAGPGQRGLNGYVSLDATCWEDPRGRPYRKILGAEITPTLLQDPESGRVIEVIPDAVARQARQKVQGTRPDDGTTARRKKALEEKKFRAALYAELRPKLEPPTRRQMAVALFERLNHDGLKALARIRSWEPPETNQHGYKHKDWRAIGKELLTLPDDEVSQFVNDMLYADELMVAPWSSAKPEKLLAAAATHGVDTKKLRADLKPKAKAKAKPKGARKPAARKARGGQA